MFIIDRVIRYLDFKSYKWFYGLWAMIIVIQWPGLLIIQGIHIYEDLRKYLRLQVNIIYG